MSKADPQTPITETQVLGLKTCLDALAAELGKALFGQEKLIDSVIVGLVAKGHVLIEGLPGLGKTELVKALSKALQLDCGRVQFTPDLLPGDITGNPVLQENESGRREFVFQKGPLFTQLLLADEINRASPKTQSALLEAMQERRVTVFGETRPLPEPFFVFATQNPIELEGTYPLPEAQVDRFLFKLNVGRNSVSVIERIIAHRDLGEPIEVSPVMTRDELLEAMRVSRKVYLPPPVINYIARLVDATHPGQSKASYGVKYGCSPRAAIGLAAAGRARALARGRVYVSFEDVQALATETLQHRIVLDYHAKVEGVTGATIVARLLEELRPDGLDLPKALSDAKLK